MDQYLTITTDKGDDLIAKAALDGAKVNVVNFAVGDGNGGYYLPDPTMTGLKNELWRGGISSATINNNNANIIDIRAIIPPDTSSMTIRELGVFDDQDNLIAIGNTAAIEKPDISSGAAVAVNAGIHIKVSSTQAMTVTVDPGAAATVSDIIRIDIAIGQIKDDIDELKDKTEETSEKLGDLTGEDIPLNKQQDSETIAEAIEDINEAIEDIKQKPTLNVEDSLTSSSASDALSAAQGKALDEKKLDKIGNASETTNTFAVSENRINITSGEELSTSLGKISRYLADLKTVAFTGDYYDLENISTSFESYFTAKAADWTEYGGTFTYTAAGINEPQGTPGSENLPGSSGSTVGKYIHIPVVGSFNHCKITSRMKADTRPNGNCLVVSGFAIRNDDTPLLTAELFNSWTSGQKLGFNVHSYWGAWTLAPSPANMGLEYAIEVSCAAGKIKCAINGTPQAEVYDMASSSFNNLRIFHLGYNGNSVGSFQLYHLKIEN
ncbi:hypothetical protein FACS1894127_5720 [Clostridia bacterium]|nr:hypothetical protein FACS1894127_5720 [Clostridia bacterium]